MIPSELVVPLIVFVAILFGYVLGKYSYSKESEDDDS